MSMYEDGDYWRKNPTFHVERSPWKAREIMTMLNSHGIEPRTVCEVGCGAGEVLAQLSAMLPDDCRFVGYDVSPELESMWRARENGKISFVCRDFLMSTESYDVLLFVDVVEHIEDYIGFLRRVRDRGQYKVFKMPLEVFAVLALLGHKYPDLRAQYGHLHYFNRHIFLSVLRDLGFKVIDWSYIAAPIALSSPTFSILSRMAWLPRSVMSKVNTELTARLLGGFSLLVLAE